MTQTANQLSEQYVQDAFHRYLKSSLTQAKVERLIDAELLSSAQADLMITGPALCLYFAALRCTTNPPSVPLPRSTKNSQPMELSSENCPPAFTEFLYVWGRTVPHIQALAPEHQHDLARVICGLEPLSSPLQPAVHGISADLRAVAIEISQRRSFQDRYAGDLQAALDSGDGHSSPGKKASFVPPPTYEASSSPNSSPNSSPRSSIDHGSSRPVSAQYANHNLPPQSPSHLSPYSGGSNSTGSGWPSRSPSPTFLAPDAPAIEFIRETLYASIADALGRMPSLRALLKQDPPRAYFACVAIAILDVSTTSMTSDGSVVGVLGTPLTLADCPPPLRPFMMELGAIGRQAKEIEEDDDSVAMQLASQGKDIPPTRMDRVRIILEQGVGATRSRRQSQEGRRSVEGRAIAFANRINGLSLGLTKLKQFRERQDDVFKVLAGVGS
ncbi:hypothetical protein C8J56DRAFT_939103 [Mycena floridula]|nr:hypothetical protein C8J56DRAFT_939103 [Mycena floridula]